MQINKKTTTRFGDSNFKRIPYNSFEEFISDNPKCCETGYDGGGEMRLPDLFERLTANYFERVGLFIKEYFLDENGNKVQQKWNGVAGLSNCGKFIKQ